MTDTHITLPSDAIHELALDKLLDCPSNPRRHYSDAGLAELADSIKAVGRVLEPLLVRPIEGRGNLHEVVFGHRRKRAAERAGLATVPCMVRTMTDAEVLLAQLHENMQREDCSPLEEADGIARLMRDLHTKVDDVAQQLGISRRQVYSRLKLADAAPPVRKALQEGRIGVETANAIARVVGEKLQEQALQEALEHVGQDRRGYRDTVAKLNERFTQQLKAAIFDTNAEDLLPEAGSCKACPKRSGNAPELFGDLVDYKSPGYSTGGAGWGGHIWLKKAGPDICTDPACHQAKHKAHLAKVAADLQAKGQTVVSGNAAKQALSATGELKTGGAYVPAERVRDVIKQLPAGERPEVVTVVDQRTGKTVKAVKRADLGTSVATAAATSHDAKRARSDAQAAKDHEDRQHREAENVFIFAAMRERLHATPLASTGGDLFWLRRMTALALGTCGSPDTIQAWHGDDVFELVEQVPMLGPADLNKLLLDALLADDASDYDHSYPKAVQNVEDAARHLGVDVAEIRVQARAQREADAAKAAEAQAAEKAASTPSPAARAPKGAGKAKGGAVMYRDPATGSTWSGRGLKPAWLKVKLEDGAKLEDFAVASATAGTAPTPPPAARAPTKRTAKAKGDGEAHAQAELGLESTLAADTGRKNSFTKPAEAGDQGAPDTTANSVEA